MNWRRACALALAVSSMTLMSAALVPGAAAQKPKPSAKGKQKPIAKPAAADEKGLIEAGKKVYAAQGCAACHSIGGTGGKTGPALDGVGKRLKHPQLVDAIRNPKKLKPSGIMPAYGPDKINDKQLKALVAYMHSLK